MSNSILVTYATRFGSTEEVAEAIAEALRERGQAVDCLTMDTVQGLSGYRAILIGSAVNYAAWLPAAVEFVQANREALKQTPVALFTVHIQNIADDPESRQRRQAYLDEVRPYVQPVSEGYFAGRFDRRGARELLPRWMAWLVPTFDYRKWEKIKAWAKSLQPLLDQVPVATTAAAKAAKSIQMKGDDHVTVST